MRGVNIDRSDFNKILLYFVGGACTAYLLVLLFRNLEDTWDIWLSILIFSVFLFAISRFSKNVQSRLEKYKKSLSLRSKLPLPFEPEIRSGFLGDY